MPALSDSYDRIARGLEGHFGRPPLPGEGLPAFEAIIAVALSGGLGPDEVEKALDGLSQAGLLFPEALARAEIVEIQDAIRERGVPVTVKALGPIKRLGQWLTDQHHGSAKSLHEDDDDGLPLSTDQIREELAEINGLGPGTIESILLFALRRPTFPITRPLYRILFRHGWIDGTEPPDEVRDLVVRAAGESPEELAWLAVCLEKVGNRFCRPRVPKCEHCPLESVLPEAGPCALDA